MAKVQGRRKYREERVAQIKQQLGLEDGDAVFFCAGVPKAFADFAGRALSSHW